MNSRRQHPISIYIVDLCCHSEMLLRLMENIHDAEESKIQNAERQKDLDNSGLKVIGFTIKEILNNLVYNHTNNRKQLKKMRSQFPL